jgi:hypothetical protein
MPGKHMKKIYILSSETLYNFLAYDDAYPKKLK